MKRIAIGLLLGVLILLWISRHVDGHAVLDSVARASPAWLGLALAAIFLALWLKGERWAMAISAGRKVRPRRRLFSSMLIGMAGNIALPARVGDFVRAFVLRKHNGVAVTRSLTASWSVQVLDFLAVTLLLWALAPASGLASKAALRGVAFAALLALGFLALVRRRPKLLLLVERLPGWIAARLRPLLESAHHGLAFLDSWRTMASAVALTGAVWLAESGAILCGLRAFGLEPPLAAGPLLASAIGLSFVLPLTPGSLGTYQLAAILVLGAYGIGREQAFAFGIGFQAVTQLAVLLCGFVAFQREGLDWRGLWSTVDRSAASEDVDAST